ncbi:hypothetical protein [Fontivita pretiosa]|uniref:hypothetical protein n=1 Tax=Fontivita pretiosa TaxID=2989684 RepID=UPI003D16B131
MALLLFVTRLFATSRELASNAAPILFAAFAEYQVIVGMVACAAGTLLSLLSRRPIHAMLTLLMLLALAAALLVRGWTFEMNRLSRTDVQQMRRFQTLHRRSEYAYTAATAALLVAGIGLSLTSAASTTRPPETKPETAGA